MNVTVTRRLPKPQEVDLDPALKTLSLERTQTPFSEVVVDLVGSFSYELMRHPNSKKYPELKALAFWTRPAAIRELRQQFADLATEETVLGPRGTVFHIPPANVDTIFVYSWVLSLLVGNRNIVRLSGRTTPVTDTLVSILGPLIERSTEIRRANLFITYGHEATVTGEISSRCDVRMIWGGDTTVAEIREVPLPVQAKEITFPDRESVSVIKSRSYLDSTDGEREVVAGRLFNDAYWFDQLGCSSPTTIFWVGEDLDAREASRDLATRLEEVIREKRYRADPGVVMRKFTRSFGAVMDGTVIEVNRHSNELMSLTLDSRERSTLRPCGGGLFGDVAVASLNEITAFVSRKWQTVGHYGFAPGELRSWASSLQGLGVDRIVPMGEALSFNRYWDGYDLLQELTRRIYVQTKRGLI